MESKCDFGILLNKPCHKTYYTRKVGMKNIVDICLDDQDILLWRAGLLNIIESRESKSICFHHEKVFGEVFTRKLRKNDKCCGTLKSHKRKVKGKKKIALFSNS